MYQAEGVKLIKTQTPIGHYRVTVFYGDEVLAESLPSDEATINALIDDLEYQLEMTQCSSDMCFNLAVEFTEVGYENGRLRFFGPSCASRVGIHG